ncbi:unnamed protein product [Arabidopsis lyrata]|nr:unnamed protein product [Arabidopsis lyrata]
MLKLSSLSEKVFQQRTFQSIQLHPLSRLQLQLRSRPRTMLLLLPLSMSLLQYPLFARNSNIGSVTNPHFSTTLKNQDQYL